MRNPFKQMGPGVLVTAAFVGPGTVTVCTLAGVQFGYSLLWALILSIIATIVLQEMAARVGLVTQKGLAAVIREQLEIPLFRWIAIILILGAIVIGNAAYEAGNITGATLGVAAIDPGIAMKWIPSTIGILAFVLLYLGNYKLIERGLVLLVLIMSMAFLVTAVLTRPDWTALLEGMFHAQLPEGSLLTVVGLIGTTVVPYNLFLHASVVREKWKDASDLKHAKRDSMVAILVGGLVSMSIVIAAAAIQGSEISSGADLGKSLTPLMGGFANYFIGIGLFAAGITSAITAPLAAAYVADSCFGWNAGFRDRRFRAVWMLILLLGVVSSSAGFKPIELIRFAQVANGVLLPLIALFLLWVVNRRKVLGKYKNSIGQNILALIVITIAVLLGMKSIFQVFEIL
jgi:NRAMP (natural resistance-associated macrophage protein)-like metal ion transporter